MESLSRPGELFGICCNRIMTKHCVNRPRWTVFPGLVNYLGLAVTGLRLNIELTGLDGPSFHAQGTFLALL
jgi:hypothetical protein